MIQGTCFFVRAVVVAAVGVVFPSVAQAEGEANAWQGRAAEGDEVVLRRLYPKARRFEVGTDVGLLLNPAFVNTTILQLSGRYFVSETWGLGLAFGLGRTEDRNERRCVESFYNDPDHEVSAPCAAEDGGEGVQQAESANVGPAYVPIRELRQMVTLYGDYTIAYGKQIILQSVTSHFDLRLRFGAGMTRADVQAERTSVRGDPDRPARGPFSDDGGANPGVGPEERDDEGLLYGDEGRPAPERQSIPHLYLAVAEDLQLLRRFYLSGELAAYLLLGGDSGPEPFFIARLGAGVRF